MQDRTITGISLDYKFSAGSCATVACVHTLRHRGRDHAVTSPAATREESGTSACVQYSVL